MKKAKVGLLVLLMASAAVLAACSNGAKSFMNIPTSPQNPLPVLDTPVGTGVTLSLSGSVAPGSPILSFGTDLTGLVVQPGSVNLLDAPVHMELKTLETSDALIRLSAPGGTDGTYSSVTLTFASPEGTIFNNTGAAIGNCAMGAICQIHPPLVTASVDLSGDPFPLDTASPPVVLRLELDIAASLSNDMSSFNPTLKATATTIDPNSLDSNTLVQRFSPMFGLVVGITLGPNDGPLIRFYEAPVLVTLNTPIGEMVVDASYDDSYQGFAAVGCTDSNMSFSCLQPGQTWELDTELFANFITMGSWGLDASRIRLLTKPGIEGVVVRTDGNSSLDLVVLKELPAIALLDIGSQVHVNLADGTTFQGGSSTLGLNFGSASDLMPGQVVWVSVTSGPSGTPAEITTDEVALTETTITARVAARQNADNFTVDNLPALLAGTQVQVQAPPGIAFDGLTDASTLNVGDTVSLAGRLFKTGGNPVLEAIALRKR